MNHFFLRRENSRVRECLRTLISELESGWYILFIYSSRVVSVDCIREKRLLVLCFDRKGICMKLKSFFTNVSNEIDQRSFSNSKPGLSINQILLNKSK